MNPSAETTVHSNPPQKPRPQKLTEKWVLVKEPVVENKPNPDDLGDDWELVNGEADEEFHLVEMSQGRRSSQSFDGGCYTPEELEKVLKLAGSDFIDWELYTDCLSQELPNIKASQAQAWQGIVLSDEQTVEDTCHSLEILVKKGIPHARRGEIWMAISGARERKLRRKKTHSEDYQSKLHDAFGERVPRRIGIPPTWGLESIPFSEHYLNRLGESAAMRVLSILRMDHPSIEYVPCVPILALNFLLFLSEEDCYYLLSQLIETSIKNKKYFPVSRNDFEMGPHSFSLILSSQLPKVWSVIENSELERMEWFSPWLSNFFLGVLPLGTMLRVLDWYLLSGNIVIYKAALAVVTMHNVELKNAQLSHGNWLNLLLQFLSQTYNEDFLIKEALKVKIVDSQLSEISQFENHFQSGKASSASKVYYRCKITVPSAFFPDETFEFIYEWLPMSLRIQDPFLRFSTASEGYNMNHFLNVICSIPGPTLLLMKTNNAVFGAFIDCEWRRKEGFIGGRDCFLCTISPNLRCYPYRESALPNILFVDNSAITFGLTNTGPAIHITNDWYAWSKPSPVFGNPSFFGEDVKVEIVAVELWIFG